LLFSSSSSGILVQEAVQVLVVYEDLGANKVEEGEMLLQVVLKGSPGDQ
jgi:hypothetical protein